MNTETPERRQIKVRAPKIELHQLRYAVAAADLGSFRQAAEVSLIKRSTLSRSVQQLEHTVGVRLFERSGNGVRATPAGRAFLKASRSILKQMDVLEDLVDVGLCEVFGPAGANQRNDVAFDSAGVGYDR
ncbi:LysR family transcriptional regulator [Bradyrhizobium valentinum]|uniref:LysR family transcriptional regulator n=1 Tax=Bradyrhizobium valentinum TaxID=1518501 RepID=UPI0009EB8BA7|nr:LysR family transcriptional regulator [Bradyrhizobium valentinum]